MHALHQIIASLVRRTPLASVRWIAPPRAWLVALVTVILCAAFAARAVAALVEASYLAPSLHGAALAPKATTPPKPAKSPDGTGLVVRNMFCSTCDPVRGGSGPTDFFRPEAVLIATSVGIDSRATVRAFGSEAQGSFGVGDQIPGVGMIEHIGWISIDVVDAENHHGRLTLLDGLAVSRGDAGAATPAPTAAAEPWAGRIKKIDDHTFDVDRDLVRELVSGSVKPGGARISPVVGDKGELKGLRLSGVTVTSLPGALGLKNGDVLSEVNSTHIQSANTLLDLYARLDELHVVLLEGTRGGKPLAIELRLK